MLSADPSFRSETLPGVVFLPNGQTVNTPYPTVAKDYEYMGIAIQEGHRALELGNYPVGAVLVNEKGDIWPAHADEHSSKRLNGHAERNAIEKYNRETGELSLQGLALYINLVPCVGCSQTLDQGELSTLFFAADYDDVRHVTTDDNGNGVMRVKGINMPDVLKESPRTMLVVSGLMKAASLELFVRRKDQQNQEQARLTEERRRGY